MGLTLGRRGQRGCEGLRCVQHSHCWRGPHPARRTHRRYHTPAGVRQDPWPDYGSSVWEAPCGKGTSLSTLQASHQETAGRVTVSACEINRGSSVAAGPLGPPRPPTTGPRPRVCRRPGVPAPTQAWDRHRRGQNTWALTSSQEPTLPAGGRRDEIEQRGHSRCPHKAVTWSSYSNTALPLSSPHSDSGSGCVSICTWGVSSPSPPPHRLRRPSLLPQAGKSPLACDPSHGTSLSF